MKFEFARFKELCREKGMKQTALYESVGRSRSYSSDLNRGIQPHIEYVQAWADALGTTPEYLYGLTDKKNKPTGNNADEPTPTEQQLLDILKLFSPDQQRLLLDQLAEQAKRLGLL